VALQLALGAICGYLTWSIVATLVWAAPVPEVRLEMPELPTPHQEPLTRYALISERNLFHSQAGPSEAPEPTEEPLAESKLSVKLHGTAATIPPEFGVAAVEDLKTHEHLQVRAGDMLQGARVVRVERSRIVVDNRGRLEEILLEDAPAPAPGARRLTQRFAAAQKDGAPETTPSAEPAALGLFREADLRPKLEGTTMVGMIVNRVSEGSRLETAGLLAGDVITGVNGASLQGNPQSFDLVRGATEKGEMVLEVERNGQVVAIQIEPEAETN
jgi:general secretion pathway protein C